MNDLSGRLRDAGTALLGFRGALVAAEPWPLSAAYGTEPEADWGPREVLAHVNEMLVYWVVQLEGVLAGDPAAAVPFGRTADDPTRLGRIARDRERTTGELVDSIATGLKSSEAFLDRLRPAEHDRLGLHSARGEMTVGVAAERFLVSHLEDHVVQLREILARPAAG